MFKTVAIILLLLILASLFSGVIFLFKDTGKDKRMVTSLTIRVVLSVLLILVLVVGYFTGNIQPHRF